MVKQLHFLSSYIICAISLKLDRTSILLQKEESPADYSEQPKNKASYLDAADELLSTVGFNGGAPLIFHQPYFLAFEQMDPRKQCTLRSIDAYASKEDPHIVIYPNAPMADKNAGIDLIPETRHELPVLSRAAQLDQGGTLSKRLFDLNRAHGKIQLASCDETNQDGGFVARRLGPVLTTGSQSWVEFGLGDIGVRDILAKNPAGFWIVEVSTQPVDETGSPLGYPPLHLHHMHWIPGKNLFRRDAVKCFIFGDAGNCFAETAGVEIHGDYQCKRDEGGLDCLNRGNPTGTGRLIKEHWGLQSHIIDARPTGSPQLTWYLQSTFKWKKKEAATLKPLSTIEFGQLMRTGGGLTRGGVFLVRTDSPSWHWWTDTFRRKGQLVHFILHTHAKAFREVLVFQSTPKDIGLDGEYFRWVRGYSTPSSTPDEEENDKTWNSQRPEDFGFSSNADLKRYLLENLAQTQKETKADPPSLKCVGLTSVEKIDGFSFDRKPAVCCKAWTFQPGDAYTAVSFFDYNKTMRSLGAPNIDLKLFPMHIGFFFHYIGEHEGSMYDTEQGTQLYPPPNLNLVSHDLFNTALGAALMWKYGTTTPPDRLSFLYAKYLQWSVAAEILLYWVASVFAMTYWPVTLLILMSLGGLWAFGQKFVINYFGNQKE